MFLFELHRELTFEPYAAMKRRREQRVLCKKCGKTLIARRFDAHMNLHTGERPFKCSICRKAYPSQNSLTRHIQCHTGPEAGTPTDPEAGTLTSPEANTSTDQEASTLKVSTSTTDVKSNQQTLVTACDSVTAVKSNQQTLVTACDSVTAENELKMVVSIPIHIKVCINTSQENRDTGAAVPPAIPTSGKGSNANTPDLASKKRFKCSHCDNSYFHRRSLNKHLRVNHIQNISPPTVHAKKSFQCSECDKCYKWKRNLVVHCQRQHNGAGYAPSHNISPPTVPAKKSFHCSECDKCYNWKRNLVVHCQRQHSGAGCAPSQPKSKLSTINRRKPSYPCCCCDLTLDSLMAYKNHLFSHSSKATCNMLCSVCGRRFHSVGNLWLHQKKMHSQYRMSHYKGLDCLKPNHWKGTQLVKKSMHKEYVQQKRNLSSTDRSQSVSLEPLLVSHGTARYGKGFKCPICGKVLTRMSHFRAHINLHTGEYTYSCYHCDKSFHNHFQRKKHIENEHTEMKQRLTQKKATKKHSSYSLSKESKQIHNPGLDVGILVSATLQTVSHQSTRTPNCPDMLKVNKDGRFACQQCEKSYLRVSYLKEHIFFNHPPPRPPKHMKLRSDEDQPLWQGFHIDTHDRITYNLGHKPPLQSKIDERKNTVRTKCMAKSATEMDLSLPVQEAGDDAALNNHTTHDLDGGKSILPVCGEIQVEDRRIVHPCNDKQQNVYAVSSDCVVKKHGSWNVFYFTDNPTP